jgi:hypothetical protein
LAETCFLVCGGIGSSKRMLGPEGVEPENKEERRGKMKRRIRGRREVRIEDADWGTSSPLAGLLLGLPPPNWWTRTPGPPPKLKTKPGPVSKPGVYVSFIHE